jgi:hypothetical protein
MPPLSRQNGNQNPNNKTLTHSKQQSDEAAAKHTENLQAASDPSPQVSGTLQEERHPFSAHSTGSGTLSLQWLLLNRQRHLPARTAAPLTQVTAPSRSRHPQEQVTAPFNHRWQHPIHRHKRDRTAARESSRTGLQQEGSSQKQDCNKSWTEAAGLRGSTLRLETQ